LAAKLSFDRIACCCRSFTHRRLSLVERFEGGLSNSNFKLHFESAEEPVVLRIYERDPAACRKEIALLSKLRSTVPAPEVLHAEPGGTADVGAFVFLRYIDGITFRQLKSTGSSHEIQQAAYSIGKTLAAIGEQDASDLSRAADFSKDDPKLIERTGAAVHEQLTKLFSIWAPRLRSLEDLRRLVHGDFRKQNVLVRSGDDGWQVAAILDWELAFAGSPLHDIGLFLRYENLESPVEPAFSNGFRDGGGELPVDWFALSRVLDLASLCRSLAEPDLPSDIETELIGLVRRTLREFEGL
jgi:aminoglycoside phosphotransferase (APT) family kinase protein